MLAAVRALTSEAELDALKSMEEGLKEMRQQGVNLESDVFDVFGPRCALVSVPQIAIAGQPLQQMLRYFRSMALIMDVDPPGPTPGQTGGRKGGRRGKTT